MTLSERTRVTVVVRDGQGRNIALIRTYGFQPSPERTRRASAIVRSDNLRDALDLRFGEPGEKG